MKLSLELNVIETNIFFLQKERVNKIELGIKKRPNGIGKCQKRGVNRVEVPHHLQVWECPPLPPPDLGEYIQVTLPDMLSVVNVCFKVVFTRRERSKGIIYGSNLHQCVHVSTMKVVPVAYASDVIPLKITSRLVWQEHILYLSLEEFM